MAAVELTDIVKAFGSVEVLHRVSLSISDGEFVVLVGPSGCGKSTLLRLIAGLETVTSGELLIAGNPVNEVPPKRRDIAMVFQNYALYPHMTIAQNMGFGLKLRGVAQQAINAKVQAAAETLGLDQLMDRYPKQLSGGQRQRVAMGRAIVRDPRVFLFDEPLSNLDAKLRVQMRAEIKALHQRIGTTMIYVTHDQVEAMTMADRIVVMRDGNIEQVGTPFELFDTPVNVHVAGLIGSPSMNLLRGNISRSSKSVFETSGGVKLPSGSGGHVSLNQPYTYGIRPEHIEITEGKGGVEAKVEIVEPLGSETLVLCTLKDGAQINVLVRERKDFRPSSHVKLAPSLSHVHLFDFESGKRIGS